MACSLGFRSADGWSWSWLHWWSAWPGGQSQLLHILFFLWPSPVLIFFGSHSASFDPHTILHQTKPFPAWGRRSLSCCHNLNTLLSSLPALSSPAAWFPTRSGEKNQNWIWEARLTSLLVICVFICRDFSLLPTSWCANEIQLLFGLLLGTQRSPNAFPNVYFPAELNRIKATNHQGGPKISERTKEAI